MPAVPETIPIKCLRRRGRLITIYEIRDGNQVLSYGWHALGKGGKCRDAQEATRKSFECVDKAMKSG
jgi:hypothetical protein